MNKSLKVFVTGATGLLGSAIVRKLVSEGYTVRALFREGADRSLLEDLEAEIEWVEGDVLDILGLDRQVAGADYVVHAAAMVSFVPRDRNRMFQVNIEGTANVVNACLRNHTRKYCHISSVAALGRPELGSFPKEATIEVNEEQRWTDSPSNSSYAKTKYLAELEVWRGIAEGLDAVIVSPSVILGEGDWGRSSTRLFKYAYDENLFYSDGLLNYVDVKDVSEAVVRLLFSDRSGERFIANGGTISYKDFFRKAASAMQRKAPRWKVSPFLAEVVWRLEAVRSRLTGSKPLLTRETARAALHRYRFAGEKLTAATGLEYRSLENTLLRVAESFKV